MAKATVRALLCGIRVQGAGATVWTQVYCGP